jgi:hypothetical protein
MVTRRQFLKGLSFGAAAALFSPFMRSIEAAANGPRRMVIFVEGNGIEPHFFLPDATKTAIEAAGADPLDGVRYLYTRYQHDAPVVTESAGIGSARSLGAMAPLQDKSAIVLGLSSKVCGGGHSTETGALSCTRSQPGAPAGPTIDHVLSTLPEVRATAPFQAVRLGVVGGNTRLNYSTCAYGVRKPAPITADPSTAFQSLFGSVAQGAGMQSFRERSQLLDFALADVNRALSAFSGNSRERQKLERYLESLENAATRQEQILNMEPTLRAVKPAEPADSPLYTSEAPLDRLQAQVDIGTSALLGGLTNVVVIALGTGTRYFSLQYPSLIDLYPEGDMVGGHDVRHYAEDGAAGYIELLANITDRHVGMMAQMAQALDATPEAGGEGTMLDNTLMLYMSDNGEKHHSKAEEWPMLLVGGQNLGFRTDGRSVVFPRVGNDANRQVSNMFNTLGHAAGMELNDFGAEGPSRIAEGPLSEIWAPPT